MDERDVMVEDGRAVDGAEAREHEVERALSELQARYDEATRALEETRGQLEAAERRRRIDQMLVESDAVDLEAARLLTEAAVERMDETDVERAVSDLRRSKPYLFRRSGGAVRSGAMSPRPVRRPGVELDDAAEAAATSGDRRDLLRYLRMRRK